MLNEADLIFACTHCKVCSIKLSEEEANMVNDGQLMAAVCPVCGNEVIINGD